MKKSMFIKKIILFIALISFILSCNNSQNYNHNINANNKRYSDIIFEDIIEENIINENVLEENILEENIIYENILEEDIIYETLINEIEILENILDENVILESAIVEVSTIEELEGNIKNKEYSDDFWQDIDWAPVITKFAVGTSVIIITAVLSVATIDTPLHVVFLSSFKGAVKGASIGAPSGAAINSLTQIALNGGKIDGWQKYAIEGAADGFMWGSIMGAIEGGIKGYNNIPIPDHPQNVTPKNPSVPYVRETVKTGGKVYKGYFPKFKSGYNVKLPKSLWKAKDREQFRYALELLKAEIQKNPNKLKDLVILKYGDEIQKNRG